MNRIFFAAYIELREKIALGYDFNARILKIFRLMNIITSTAYIEYCPIRPFSREVSLVFRIFT